MSTTTFTPPYARSWVDRLYDAIERVPGPVWLVHVAWFAVCAVVGIWFNSPNYPDIPGMMFTTISASILAGTHWLRFTATKSVDRIRPALDLDDTGVDRLRYRLANTPPKIAWIGLAFEAVYLPFYVMSEAEPFGYRHLSPGVLIPGLIVWAIGETIAWVMIYQTIRRLVIIGQIRRDLATVELFRQQPLYSFSPLTMRSAVVMLFLFGYVPLLSLGKEAFTDPLYLGSLAAGAVLAAAVAIVPLSATHRAIADEKRARATANGQRIEDTVAAMAQAHDSGDTAAMEARQKQLGALLTERDLIAKAGTWPWAPGTVRTFATTILVPVFLLLANRIADRWFG